MAFFAAGGPSSAFALQPPFQPTNAVQPAPAYVWGDNGARLTPDDIARQRAMAAQNLQAGSDYSPVGSWTQGLARVSQALLGGIEEKKADRASKANAVHSDAVLQALMNPGGSPSNAQLLSALGDPSLSPVVQKVVGAQYARMNPAPQQPTEMQRDYQWLQTIDPAAAQNFIGTKTSAPPVVGHNADGTITVYPAGMVPQGSAAQSGPQPGAVEGGYQFQGGDPGDQNNWKPVGGAGPQTPPTFP